jgi:hypothetical protein
MWRIDTLRGEGYCCAPMRRNLPWMLLLVATAPAALGEQVSDFTLEDTNPASVRFENLVSPRDYQLQVTGYYFGTATT